MPIIPSGYVDYLQAWVLFPKVQEVDAPSGVGFAASNLWFLLTEPCTDDLTLDQWANVISAWLTGNFFSAGCYGGDGLNDPRLNMYSGMTPGLQTTTTWGLGGISADGFLPARTAVVFNKFSSDLPPLVRGKMFVPCPPRALCDGNTLNDTGVGVFNTIAFLMTTAIINGAALAQPAIPQYSANSLMPWVYGTASSRLGQYRKRIYDKHHGTGPLLGPKPF